MFSFDQLKGVLVKKTGWQFKILILKPSGQHCVCVHDRLQIPGSKSVRGGGLGPYLLTNYPPHKKHICSEISPISPRNVFDDKTNSLGAGARGSIFWGGTYLIWFDKPTTRGRERERKLWIINKFVFSKVKCYCLLNFKLKPTCYG